MTVENSFRIPAVKDGETFTLGDMEFIKFPDVDGKTPVVMKDIAFFSRFGDSNDFRASAVLKRLRDEILPKIIAVIGEDNVCTFKLDLTTLDGLKPYEGFETKIGLPTFDFYRSNVSIFDKFNPDCWWWLATPESALPHDSPYWIVCVAPSGFFSINSTSDFGVRPFLFFNSSIFESSGM